MTPAIPIRAGLMLASSLFLTCAARADESTAPKPPEIVQRAVASYETNVRGVIGMERHFSTLIDAGVAKHSEVSESAILFKDGVFEQLHYYRVTDDGKEFSTAQLSERDKQSTDGWSAGKVFFKEPYDRRFTGDYAFALVSACAECAPGTVAVKFESTKHDAQHGAGTMWIETADARVVKLTYAPYAYPPHATSGTITETSGAALPNLWYVVRIDQAFTGRMFVLRGTATFTGIFDHFERFGSVAEGASAIRERTLGTAKT